MRPRAYLPGAFGNMPSIGWLYLALILPCLAPNSLCGQSTPKQPQSPDQSAEEHVKQLIESLPSKSMWRNMLEHGARGEGIHRPWMDEMRKLGITLVVLTFEFDWTQGGMTLKDLKNWTFASARYFADYDYPSSQPITDPTRLKAIKASGLEGMLEAAALGQAKQGVWFESPGDQHPAQQTGTGYRQIFFADNEWLPVQMFPWFGQYQPGTTPLMHAALLGDVGRIRKLLAEGADVNAVSPDGSTALLYATGGESPDALQILLAAGADVNKATNHGATPLMAASGGGNLLMVGLLLKAGADPNSRDTDGHTALSIATERNHFAIVRLLKLAGAHK